MSGSDSPPPMAERRTGGGRRPGGRRQDARPGGRPVAADPARRAAYDLLREVDEHDAYANLVLPRLLRRAPARRPRRGAGHRAGLRHAARARAPGRRGGAVRRPPARHRRPGRARPAAARRVPAAAHPGAAARGGRDHRRPGPGRRSGPGGRVRQRRAAPGGRARRRGVDRAAHRGPGPDRCPRDAHRASRAGSPTPSPPPWRPDADDELAAALAADDARPATHLVARPGRSTREELLELPGAEPGPYSPYAVRLAGGGDPAGVAAVRHGRAGVQDEGSQLCALALAARAARRAGTSAGSTCAPAPAARRRCSRRSAAGAAPARRQRACARTAPSSSRQVAAAWRRRRSRSPTPASSPGVDGRVRPRAARRPVHRAGRAAPPPGGALAPAGRATWASWPPLQRELLAAALRLVRPGRGRRLRDLLAAPGRDRRGRRRGARPSCSTPARAFPGVPDLGAGPDRAAVAAPARHRRHVLRAAAGVSAHPSSERFPTAVVEDRAGIRPPWWGRRAPAPP